MIRGLKISSLQPVKKPPLDNAMKVVEMMSRTIRVLLPSIQFIVDSERDAFFEAAIRVCRPSNDISFQLNTRPIRRLRR